jgi:hypothetical protein
MTVIGTGTAIVTVVTEIETNAAIGADSRPHQYTAGLVFLTSVWPALRDRVANVGSAIRG